MRKLFKIIPILLFFWAINGCSSIMQMANIVNCDFRMKSLTQTKLAGVNIENKSSISSLGIMDVGKLTTAYLNKNIPLSFQLNLEAKNPNSSPALMTKFDWILSIDDIEMTRGTNSEQVQIPGNNGISTIPLQLSFNIYELLQNESKDALLNFGFNLADASDKPTRIGLKLKPTINIGQVPVSYPSYINVTTQFGGN